VEEDKVEEHTDEEDETNEEDNTNYGWHTSDTFFSRSHN
jgi:hypothetical protein